MSNGDRNTVFSTILLRGGQTETVLPLFVEVMGLLLLLKWRSKMKLWGFFQSLIGSDFAIPTSEVNLAACNLVTSPISSDMAAAMVKKVSGEESPSFGWL
ncbi:hypothetical protein TB2_027144 [Malus domestica]